ncbi:hypothetical protein DSO57_1030827 [Entomophthora muscae]|uniref:Uncharacterized protein n=1 Tax=Entomophthora muscae TaxID=34485 RepID=A0ACC2SQ21_9FUNG|nr:hypothetical protein DSO57_1030827 [Entomophthora muscae]
MKGFQKLGAEKRGQGEALGLKSEWQPVIWCLLLLVAFHQAEKLVSEPDDTQCVEHSDPVKYSHTPEICRP